MYYQKILNFVSDISKDDNLSEERKTELYSKIKELSGKVMDFSCVVLDVKLGTSEIKTQEEYDRIIEDAKTSTKNINSMFCDYYGEKLFEKIPKSTTEMYDLSSVLCDEMKEMVRNDVE